MTTDDPATVPAWYAASPFWALVPCPLWSPLRRLPRLGTRIGGPSGKTAEHDRVLHHPAPLPAPRLGLISAEANP